MMNKNLFSKDFNLLILGQIISILGSSLLRFALSLYVLDITGRADIFASLYAVSNIPLIISPLGGAIADRFNRRNLMVIFDFISSGIVLCLFLSMLSGNSSVWMIGVAMVLISIISAMYTPAVTASIPLLVEEDKLEGANGLVQGVQALSGVFSPIFGGILYGLTGAKMLIFLSCIAFSLSAIMEMFIKIPFIKRPYKGHILHIIVKDMRDGFLYVIKEPFIVKSIILAALLNLLLTPYFLVGSPIIFRIAMESSDALYGLGMSMINFATILGALTIGKFSGKMKIQKLYKWILMIALITLPMALAITPIMLKLGYYSAFVLFIFCAIPIAMIMTIVSIFVITKVQKKTPNENLGKVMAIITAVSQCTAPIGQIAYGVVFEIFSWKVYIPTLFVGIFMFIMAGITKRMFKKEEV